MKLIAVGTPSGILPLRCPVGGGLMPKRSSDDFSFDRDHVLHLKR
jgi:hypothetical protein